MGLNPIAIQIRAKKLGLLLRDARETARRTAAECGQACGVTDEEWEAFEAGETSPSLPQLEILSEYLNIPLDFFWKDQLLSSQSSPLDPANLRQLITLRQRIVGTLLRQERANKGYSLDDLARTVGVDPDTWNSYELGETAIPLTLLEAACEALELSIDSFLDQRSPAPSKINQQQLIAEFAGLPEELQYFISRPINRPYLELAMRLSEMSVEKLRGVAEGLLEITL